jgi:hypothetical protein
MAPLLDDKQTIRTAKQTFLQKFPVPCQDTPEAGAIVQALLVGSNEYLEDTVANRKEWKPKGQDVVQSYLTDFFAKSALAEVQLESLEVKVAKIEFQHEF